MSRSSSSRERAFAEPTVALAAVLALSFGIAAYTVVLGGVGDRRPTAEPTLERVHDEITVGGVADPERFDRAGAVIARTDTRANATLRVAGRRWRVGPAVPERATAAANRATASRRVGVALAPGRVRPGRLRVTVWR
ncbi:DUF7285 family protein [Halobaculum magnesiiphilum]|uniref:Uncharacterized protein n=1 Tax=Halobaculum magnesiiphilum TaxID=1017351 RepID=A0A8T8WCZ2_9EURY|nr:hypothetical protein [Halobaculum magnesiiphilum]QZP37614.1 hypothetical protein K6T50_00065 [Halobaculum magnesiiphilum]